jgi:hypothetical protein
MTSSPRRAAPAPATAQAAPGLWRSLRNVAIGLLSPMLMCLGVAVAYNAAFHQPQPNHLKVAVVGTTAQAQALAHAVSARAGNAFDVSTVPSVGAAERQIRMRELVGAFVPDARHPDLMIATADSLTAAFAAEDVFDGVTAAQGVPLTVTNIVQPASGDTNGDALFFLLIAMTIGCYTSIAVIGTAGAALGMPVRMLVGLATSLVISVIGIVTAGPAFGVVSHDYVPVWAMSWLYCAGIVAIGIGLHTFLKRWTVMAMCMLFVVINFPSAGGVYGPDMQNRFFGALHSFWDGAQFLEGARDLLYFPAVGVAGHLVTLALWLAAGLVLIAVAAWREQRKPAVVLVGTDLEAEQEIEEAGAI